MKISYGSPQRVGFYATCKLTKTARDWPESIMPHELGIVVSTTKERKRAVIVPWDEAALLILEAAKDCPQLCADLLAGLKETSTIPAIDATRGVSG